jgi:hypothetical protein
VPVGFIQRCPNCHIPQDRSLCFPSRVIGKDRYGNVRRRYSMYCKDCLEKYPNLKEHSYPPPEYIAPKGVVSTPELGPVTQDDDITPPA